MQVAVVSPAGSSLAVKVTRKGVCAEHHLNLVQVMSQTREYVMASVVVPLVSPSRSLTQGKMM